MYGPPPGGPWGPPPPGGPWGPWGPPPPRWGWRPRRRRPVKPFEPNYDNWGDDEPTNPNVRKLTIKEDGWLGYLFGPKFSKTKRAKKVKKEDLKQKDVEIKSRTVSSFEEMIDKKMEEQGPVTYVINNKIKRK